MPSSNLPRPARMARALAVAALMAGALIAQAASPLRAAESYRVVDFDGIGNYWHFTLPPGKLAPRNVLEQRPSGCAAISVRIEPDGTPHQMRVLKSEWTPMLPVDKKLMNASLIDQLGRARFTPSPQNPQRMPVYSYIVMSFITYPVNSMHPAASTQKRVDGVSKKLAELCHVPDFVARVARATDTPLPGRN
ncbi:MAG: hypothetical protein M0P72_06315 [Metallibacterium scheffleri]|uniref:hypothetical protein n=1 Tax=Metallibacterium scheffleri TaxID=993689 RepID=UPI0026EECA9C|nr:hypothetical protein [Metallibacterium scheffleri]MCK9366745.1 hypothetical protein [Metallibacterium scheffleri]